MTETAENTSLSSYGSATASGVASLAALQELIGPNSLSDAAIARGSSGWRLTSPSTPIPARPPDSPTCTGCRAGRAGTLLKQERFRRHDWFAEGSAFLLSTQKSDGAWRLSRGSS